MKTKIKYLNEQVTLTGTQDAIKHLLNYLTCNAYDAAELAANKGYNATSESHRIFARYLYNKADEINK